MKKDEYWPLQVSSFDELLTLTNRLYCTYQAALYGDEMMIGHMDAIGEELGEIWRTLSNILDRERMLGDEREKRSRSQISEQLLEEAQKELKKFKEGFSYGREKNTPR